MAEPIFYGRNITKTFGPIIALSDVSFTLNFGETLGIVGESGSGKSTLGKIALKLIQPDNGEIFYRGFPIFGMTPSQLHQMRRHVQLIPQDPKNALNPAQTVWRNLAFHMNAQHMDRKSQRQRAIDSLSSVSLGSEYLDAYPSELSGGQAQRVAIARAISSEPDVLVCDEAVSSLDKSVQAQVLNMLCNLQSERSLSLFFITHDLNVVDYMCDQILVLHSGKVVETGEARTVIDNPANPYTRELLSAKSDAILQIQTK